ncbi:MAG: NAD(P)H-hydrate dehydratase [Verrucomicrobia bacterium]|nr:NAD(P)H-hydrate dehydratase [Verrucomicrobiota bacterium]
MLPGSHPILDCDEAREFEARLFAGDEAHAWAAMQRAGRAVATAVLRDFEEIGGFPADGRILVLAGKGHNGGDALIAAQTILEEIPGARAEVIFVFGERVLRPLAQRAWRELSGTGLLTRVRTITGRETRATGYDLSLDGIFGFQFRPPVEPRVAELLERVNAWPIRLRAAVDLPSAGLCRADFCYATGIVKTPALDTATAGRVRYLDLGFFEVERVAPNALARVLTPGVLAPLAALRPPLSDKRTYGHVLVVAGSRQFPGAALMTTLAALRSGAGLVTALVPESLVPAFAARAPEAMWIGWPETPAGGLALEGLHLLRQKLERATALVLGPGLGREGETLALAAEIVQASPVPLVLDADALQPGVVSAGSAPRVLTPHAGEWARIEKAKLVDATIVEKGPVTRIVGRASRPTSGRVGRKARPTTYHSFFGGPVLARGGSGDLLAGLIGGLLAQAPADPLLAAARGVVWHGQAADALARSHGQVAVPATQLLDFLPAVLRECASCPTS